MRRGSGVRCLTAHAFRNCLVGLTACRFVQGRTWKGATPDALARVRELLIRRGAIEDRDLKSPHEAWRVRIEKAVFTGYRSGSIYCNGGHLPELPFLYESISNLLNRP